MNKILFIIGPTASGKSGAAIKLAKKINAEIISCDSMQVYKGMDILSQKPLSHQMASVSHYMISVISPNKEFSVADYKSKVEGIIRKIHMRGKLPLIVGGSGLYVKALVDGLLISKPKDTKLRDKLFALSKKYGNKYLYNRLKKVDPNAAKNIHPNNTRRVIRALEVYKTSGTPISVMKTKTYGLASKYDIIKIFGLKRDRENLYDRINKRVDNMLKSGLLDEVERLKRKKISLTAKAALGYKEIGGYLDGSYAQEEAVELLKRNTRRFAKRQITWFKKDPSITWIEVAKDDTADKIVNKIMKHLTAIKH